MGKKKKKDDIKNELIGRATDFISLITDVAPYYDEIPQEGKPLYQSVVGWGGALAATAIGGVIDKAKIEHATLLALDTLCAIALACIDDEDQYEDKTIQEAKQLKETAEMFLAPVEARKFIQRLETAIQEKKKFDLLQCLYDMNYLFYNLATESTMEKVEQQNFCDYCGGRKLGAAAIPKFKEIFSSWLTCVQFANGLEYLAKNPDAPEHISYFFSERAEDFRDFAKLKEDELENYEEIMTQMAQYYGCIKMEAAVCVKRGIFEIEDIIKALNFDFDEFKKLVEGKEVQSYIDHIKE